MSNEINKFIKELENEIKATGKEVETEEQLLRLQDIAKEYNGEDKIISSHEIEEMIKARPEEKKIMTGYADLDAIIKGFRHKQLVVMSAATKSGKTSFCIELTTRMKDENPMWLPFEESAEELIEKFIERKERSPLFYTPARMSGNTMVWVEKKIIESKAKHNTNVVFIDQLDFLISYSADNRADRIGDVMRNLKSIARKWDVLIFLICHLTKTKMDMQPTLEDLKGSSSIAQEADTVILLWREANKQNGEVEITDNVNISVQANRRTGKTGNIKMRFDNGKFTEYDWKTRDDEIDGAYTGNKYKGDDWER